MTIVDQSKLRGKTRDRPISSELELLLNRAGLAAGIDIIYVTSGSQPGTTGQTTGSTRHNNGRAADLYLRSAGKDLRFTDSKAPEAIEKFVTACAALGANGIGAGTKYMGNKTLHVGYGLDVSDNRKLTWGENGRSANSPKWLRTAANLGWYNPPDWVFDIDDGSSEDLSEEDDTVFEAFDKPSLSIPNRFNEEVILAAQESQRKWGIPASVTLAQWALESAYGTSTPPNSNNPFGIKARSGEAFVTSWTTEVIGGRTQRVSAKFRAFPSLAAAFERHGRLLGSAGVYSSARKFLSDPDQFSDALTGVYATDPNYGSKLKSIMRTNNLYAFDVEVSNATTISRYDEEAAMSDYLSEGHPNGIAVEALQKRLTSLGYKLGRVDGLFGPLTTAALLAFQSENGVATTGVLDETTQHALNSASGRRLGKDREAVTELTLAKAGSRTIVNARRNRLASWVLGAFGALGIGNSAILNSTPPIVQQTATVPSGLFQFLNDVQSLNASSSASKFNEISITAKALVSQLNGLSLPSDISGLVNLVSQRLPKELLTQHPELTNLLSILTQPAAQQTDKMRTIFDILPTFFANDTVMQTVTQALATAGSSILPGFGGSLGVLAAGLLGRHFSNKIAGARVDDHRSGGNVNPLT